MASQPPVMADLYAAQARAEEPQTDTSLYAGIKPEDTAATGLDRSALTNKALIMALGRMKDSPDPELTLATGALQESRQLLANQQEAAVRNQIAASRAVDHMSALTRMGQQLGPNADPKEGKAISDAYHNVLAWDTQQKAQHAMEQSALDRIEEMAARDPVQAKVLMDNLQFGDANQVKRDYNVKMMKLMQLAEVYDHERDKEGWGSWAINFALGLVPTNYNFSRTGVVPGKQNSALDFLAVGRSLGKQGDALWNMPLDEFSDFVKEGGKLDQSIRANADDFVFGHYNPQAAAEIAHTFATQTTADRMQANLWGGLEVATAIPVSRISNVTRTLIGAGARREAVKGIAETSNMIAEQGVDAARAAYGFTPAEVQEGMKITALDHTASTPNSVPLGMDVATRIEAADRALADLPGIVQTERLTGMEEMNAAYEARVAEVTAQIGRPIKDISEIKYETLADGTTVKYVEYTFGKAGGGGFASERTARNAARSAGLPNADLQEVITTNTRLEGGVDPEFSLKVYHGTDHVFGENNADPMRPSSSGKLGPGAYFSPNAEIADTYSEIMPQGGSPNVRVHYVNPDKLFGHNNLEGWSLDDMKNAFKNLGIEDDNFLQDAEKLLAHRASKGQSPLLDSQTFVKQLHSYYREHDFNIGEGLNRVLSEKGYHGISANTWGDHEIAIFDPAQHAPSAWSPFKTIQDVSGQFFVKGKAYIPESGFFTNFQHTPTASWWAKIAGTAPRISDRNIHGMAVQAESTIGRMQRIIDQHVLKPFRSLNKNSKELVGQIAAAGNNHGRWWTDEEFNVMAQRATGRAASPEELDGYRRLQLANDMDWRLRNDLIYKERIVQGIENVKIGTKWGQDLNVLARVQHNFESIPQGQRVYDVSGDVHYNSRNPMTPQRLEQMNNQGYSLIRTHGSVTLPDGTEVNHLLVKRADAEFLGLDRIQLPYAEGGHRMYESDYKYFVKQASTGRQPDTGTEFYRNPNTFVAAKDIAKAREWADTMNAALRMVKERPATTEAQLDEFVFQGSSAYPSGKEFLDKVAQGHITTSHEFEAVADRELPSVYHKAGPNANSYLESDDLGAFDYLKTTGRMFYSGKGEILKDTTGNIATTVDPFDTIATSLRNITRQSGLSNYKIEALERFEKTFGEHLESGPWRNAADKFNRAPIKSSTPRDIKDLIEGQRSVTRNVLGFITPFERANLERTRQLAEAVLGDGTNKARQMAHDAVWWWKEKNPVSFLRGLAFDAKLGMFNVGQLLVQSSTMFSAMALSPKYGIAGFRGIIPMHGYLLSRGSENVLETLAKRGVGKSMGFATELEFKQYARNMYNSGFLDMNGSHVMINDYGPSAHFGGFGDAVNRGREAGRVFFYTAETYNRMISWRIAHGLALDSGLKVTDKAFNTEVARLADDYSMNMTHASSAWWQKGLLSIPTQFWAYNVRMMDAMFGARFTPAQRLRLATANLVMAGSAGIPLVEGLSSYIQNSTGKTPDIDSMLGTLDRGLIDKFWHATTGADVRIGEKIGTGGWVTNTIQDIFGAGDYGDKPFDEMLGGASWTILKHAALGSATTANAMYRAVAYSNAENGGGNVDIAREDLLRMFLEVSTLSNSTKAMMVHNYGIYKSNKGNVLAADLPSENAVFVALGFRPETTDQHGHMMAYLKEHKEDVKEAANTVRNWRQEAFTNPDKYDENMRKVRAFMEFQSPADRRQIIRQTNKVTDKSLYDHIARQYDKETLMEGNTVGLSN